ncbi:hypothetical protein GCM10017566_66210 [Amycolatopsis bartoniae]|uniref:Aldehyde dehydrogenase domain-containing protein n=1 Tax=Amycolatopsis bartoniae TaxID=941986 RepID=A0A8H9MFJ1_9PSEU|nr:hypothetical protein GCM10017566_66210 [Amycolatopsis bartoniae]
MLAGGRARGRCYPATVLVDVPESAELARHETFGPVVLAAAVDDDEAVRQANDSRYGLTAGVLTGDPERGWRWRTGWRRASCTSTTSPSITSRKCPSEA